MTCEGRSAVAHSVVLNSSRAHRAFLWFADNRETATIQICLFLQTFHKELFEAALRGDEAEQKQLTCTQTIAVHVWCSDDLQLLARQSIDRSAQPDAGVTVVKTLVYEDHMPPALVNTLRRCPLQTALDRLHPAGSTTETVLVLDSRQAVVHVGRYRPTEAPPQAVCSPEHTVFRMKINECLECFSGWIPTSQGQQPPSCLTLIPLDGRTW